jgi:hypothetical protein
MVMSDDGSAAEASEEDGRVSAPALGVIAVIDQPLPLLHFTVRRPDLMIRWRAAQWQRRKTRRLEQNLLFITP